MNGTTILMATEIQEPGKTILQWLPLAFPLFFPALWCGVLWLLATLGGWRRLSLTYPARGVPEGRHYTMQSAQLGGWCNYNGCLNMVVAAEGLHIVPFFLFRIGHPPLFIPWSSIHNAREWKFLWTHRVSFEVGDPSLAKMIVQRKILEGTPVMIS